jgi:hypothetical protein
VEGGKEKKTTNAQKTLKVFKIPHAGIDLTYETTPPFINTLETWYPNKVRKHTKREEKERV